MAFPVVLGTNTSTSASSTSHTVNLPASVTSGDLLLLFFLIDSGATVSTPSGWTLVKDLPGSARRLVCFKKTATGSEGSTVTVTTGSAFVASHCTYRIGTNNYNVTVSTGATGSDTGPDPDNLNNGTSAKYLWLAAAGSTGTLTSYPTNYSTNGVSTITGTMRVAVGTRSLEASAENPGTFVFGTSAAWVAYTLAVGAQTPVTVTSPLLTSASTIFTIGISYGATATAALLTMASSIFQAVGLNDVRTKWTKQSRSSTSWNNEYQS